MALGAVNESILMVDDSTWIIGERLLLSLRPECESIPGSITWSDGKGSWYSLSEAVPPLPPTQPLPETSDIKKVYDAGNMAAAWIVGDAVVKLKIVNPQSTREHVTLAYLNDRQPLSFTIPRVLYHTQIQDRYCIVVNKLPGQTLMEAWPALDEATKQRYATQVANICIELAEWQADQISGVDGNELSDWVFSPYGTPTSCTPEHMFNSSKELGMDCSKFHFYHCNLGPGNIIVNGEAEQLAIIDWETAGFVPREWIRTKFCVSSGMDLDYDGYGYDERVDWRRRVGRKLGTQGFPELADEWVAWIRNGSRDDSD